jgi:hypothetical protein
MYFRDYGNLVYVLIMFGEVRVCAHITEIIILEDFNNCTNPYNISEFLHINVSRDSSVGIATGYGLDVGGSIPGRGNRFFATPQIPDHIWSPPSLLSDGERSLFTRG